MMTYNGMDLTYNGMDLAASESLTFKVYDLPVERYAFKIRLKNRRSVDRANAGRGGTHALLVLQRWMNRRLLREGFTRCSEITVRIGEDPYDFQRERLTALVSCRAIEGGWAYNLPDVVILPDTTQVFRVPMRDDE